MSLIHLDALLRPSRVLLLGAPAAAPAEQLVNNLRRSLPADGRWAAGVSVRGFRRVERDAPPEVDMAVAFDAAEATSGMVARLASAGCRGLLWAADAPVPDGVLRAARPTRMRVLGARSAGVINPRIPVNASGFAQPVAPGRLALIAQSKTVAAAALDWAAGRGVGFSWVAVTGAEADVDVADLLDAAALDPQTRAVVVQLSRLRNARKFMSAARACARVKPVTVLQSRTGGPESGPDPLRSAAFRRAGFVECDSLDGLFGAIAALDRLPDVAEQRVLVAANGAGVSALGLAACQREGVQAVSLSDERRREVLQQLPGARFMPGAMDLGAAPPPMTLAALKAALDEGGVDALMYLHAPMPGAPPADYAHTLAGSGLGGRLVTVWLGLDSAIEARALSAEGGLPTFPSAGDAAYALAVRQEYRRTQELLMQTPPAVKLNIRHRAGAAQILASAAISDETELETSDAVSLLRGYGVISGGWRGRGAPRGTSLRMGLRMHAELGMLVGLAVPWSGPGRVSAAGVGEAGSEHWALPPLDALLAARLIESAGLEPLAPLVDALLGLGQLAIDQPHVEQVEVEVRLDTRDRPRLVAPPSIHLWPEPRPDRLRLALAPYPQQLDGGFADRHRQRMLVRAIRPEDEPAVLRLLADTEPDAIRLRFFRYIKHFSHAMAARLTQLDYDREIALVIAPRVEPDRIVALGHLSADPDGREAEFSVLVHQDHAGRGIGRELLARLLAHARDTGIGYVYGEVLSENRAMLGLAASLGFTPRRTEDLGVTRVGIRLDGS